MLKRRSWFLLQSDPGILLAFIVSRLMLFAVGWLSGLLPAVAALDRDGHSYSAYRLIDMWARWDAGWYMEIVERGYVPAAGVQSSSAFFPLYPYLVKAVYVAFIPRPWFSQQTIVILGLVLSNACFLAALLLISRLVMLTLEPLQMDEQSTNRASYLAALFLCVAPFSFIFSSFYSESLFLLLSIAAFYAAERGRMLPAGILGGLAAMARPVGILLVVPLFLIWLDRRRRGETSARSFVPVLLVPAGLVLVSTLLWRETGRPFGWATAGSEWGNAAAWPWTALASPARRDFINGVDLALFALCTGLSLAAFRIGPAYGLWGLICTLGALVLKGNLVSMGRYTLVAFPVFMALALLGARHPRLADVVLVASAMLLGVLMAMWAIGLFVV